MKRSLVITTIVVTAWMCNSIAQDNEMQGPSMRKRSGEQGGPGQERGMRPPAPPLLTALDRNSDKVIDADEIANSPAALKKLDKNGDGKLTSEELMPPRPQRPEGEERSPEEMGKKQSRGGEGQGDRELMGNRQGRGGKREMGQGGEGVGPQQGGPGQERGMRPPVPPFMKTLDPNGDKVIDADEIANIQQAIKKMDRNGDGKITIDEIMPRPPQMDGEQGGPEGSGKDKSNKGGKGRGRGGDRQAPQEESI